MNEHGNAEPWDLRPLADAVLKDRCAPPMLVLAAWHYRYGTDLTILTDLARRAAVAPSGGRQA